MSNAPNKQEPVAQPVSLAAVTTTVVLQSRALSATAGVAEHIGAAALLASTGPLAELKALQRRLVTTEVRQNLVAQVAKKGKGVVFEATMVARTQEHAERYV